MVVVRLKKLECIRTGGEVTEEPYLNIFIDNSPGSVGGDEDYMSTYRWGPHSMRTGDTRQIDVAGNSAIGPGVFEGRRISFFLRERDGVVSFPVGTMPRTDDHLDGVAIADEDAWPEGTVFEEPEPIEGEYEALLPIHRGMTGGMTSGRRYKLYYDQFASADSASAWYVSHAERPYSLQLEYVQCHDAQQWKDYVFIKVDGERVWGPTRMRTGDGLSLMTVSPTQIRANALISLWEEDDAGKSDFFGELSLRVDDDFRFDRPQVFTLSPDSGIVGDARYSIQYRVTRRS